MKDFIFDSVSQDISEEMKNLMRPLGLAFPSYIGEEWLNTLEELKNVDSNNELIRKLSDKNGDDKRDIFDLICSKFVGHLRLSKSKSWHSYLIASLSIDAYSRLLGKLPWVDSFKPVIEDYLEVDIANVNSPIALFKMLVESYYKTGVQNVDTPDSSFTPTGSLSFWYIVRATKKDDTLLKILSTKSNDLKEYYDLFLEKTDDETGEGEKLPNTNKYFLYLEHRLGQNSPLSENGGFDVQSSRRSIYYYNRENGIGEEVDKKVKKVVVLGKSGSGKTTMIKQLLHASQNTISVDPNYTLNPFSYEGNADIDQGGYWNPGEELPDQTTGEIVALRGNFKSFGQDVDLLLYDHNGDVFEHKLISDNTRRTDDLTALERLCSECDQLVLVLSPSLMADNTNRSALLNKMFSYAQLAISNNKDVVISLVYTMCDNYGCIVEGPRRAIHDQESANLFFRFKFSEGSEREKLWNDFAHYLPDDTKATDWTKLKADLLDKSIELWTKIAHEEGERHYNVNGYFVSALYPGQHENRQEFSNRGLLEVVSDFLQFMSPPKFFKLSEFVCKDGYDAKGYDKRELKIDFLNNGPHMKEYRLLRSDDQDTLFHKTKADFNYFKENSIPVGGVLPYKVIEVLKVKSNPYTGLPEKMLLTFKSDKFKIGQRQYFQVIGIDKFGHMCFSEIKGHTFKKGNAFLAWWRNLWQ